MTDEQEYSQDDMVRAVRKVLEELAPEADPQDIDELIADLEAEDDPTTREMNLGAAFGQFFDEEGTDAAFKRYAELIDAERVKHNRIVTFRPIPKHVPGDADEPQVTEEVRFVEDL